MKIKNLLLSALALTIVSTSVGCKNTDQNTSGTDSAASSKPVSQQALLGLKDLVTFSTGDIRMKYYKDEDKWNNPALDIPYTIDDYMTPTLTTDMLDYCNGLCFDAKEKISLVSAKVTIVTKKDLLLEDAYYICLYSGSDTSDYGSNGISVLTEPKKHSDGLPDYQPVRLTAGVPYEIVYNFNRHGKETLDVWKNKNFSLCWTLKNVDGSPLGSALATKEWRQYGIYNLQMTGYYR